ncbi:MAG: branched-chain amino acid ABC transporter permease [Chloroflexota bacterium]|nr:branched-chain amino acid ABC transporter permease [Chloroflexota bacterium]
MGYFPMVLHSTLNATAEGFDWITLGRNIINGFSFGSIYALFALGLVLIHKSSDVVNFGHGEMAMFFSYIGLSLMGLLLGVNISKPAAELPSQLGWEVFLPALLGTLLFAALMGLGIERFLLRPLAKASVLSQVMVTIGIGTLLYGLASWLWKAEPRAYPRIEAVSGPPFQLGELALTREDLTFLSVAIVMASGLFLFFRYTMVGIALRAIAQNPFAARLMGINVGRLNGLAWAMALMLAALAGMLAAPKLQLEPGMMADVAVKSFAAAVLGGINSLSGALLGGLLIGIIDNLAGFYLPDGLRATIAFLIIVAVLTIKPHGLLGKPLPKKV